MPASFYSDTLDEGIVLPNGFCIFKNYTLKRVP